VIPDTSISGFDSVLQATLIWQESQATLTSRYLDELYGTLRAGVAITLLFRSSLLGATDNLAHSGASSGIVVVTNTIAPESVSDLITIKAIESTFKTVPSTAGCSSGFVGTFSFDAKLVNKSSSPPLSDLIVEVLTLTSGNVLQNADGGPDGVGARLTVPATNSFSDGVLSSEEFVDVPFIICLGDSNPFSLSVDVLGIAE
jgi:hypothetical protein